MYMSRLSAQKEWAFMKVLHQHGFPIPKPVDQARHCILMEFIDAYPLRQVSELPSPGSLYSTLMDVIVRFAQAGLIHGDFNEFNILIRRETGEPVVIDFPQMVSTSHVNAEWYFNRDVECIRAFFRRRFQYESNLYPRFRAVMKDESTNIENFRLDVVVAASGFKNTDQEVLEDYMNLVKDEWNSDDVDSDSEEEGESDEKEEEEDEAEGHQSVAKEDKAAVDGARTQRDSGENSTVSLSTPLHPLVAEGHETNLPDSPPSPISRARHLSRSPPASRHVSAPSSRSPSSLVDRTANLSITHDPDMKEKVASEVSKRSAKQHMKYHSKRGAQKVGGRQKGSKAKQDTRVKLDRGGVWD